MSEVVAAILGAIVGGLVAWLIAGQQIRANRREAHRRDLGEAVNNLWIAADRLWESTQDAAWVVFEIQAQRAARQTPISPELEPRRQQALSEKAKARAEARHAIASMRLLRAPIDLITKAEHLAECSGSFRVGVEDIGDPESTSARSAALAEYERIASPQLG